MDAIASSSKIDGAFLDINLNGEASYFVADLLSERGFHSSSSQAIERTIFRPVKGY